MKGCRLAGFLRAGTIGRRAPPGLLALLLLAGAGCVEILDPLRQPYVQEFLVGPYGSTPSTPQPVVVAEGRRVNMRGDFALPVGGDCLAYTIEPDVAVPVRSSIQVLIRAVSTGSGQCPGPAWVRYDAILGLFEEGVATVTIVHRTGSVRTEVFRGEVELR